MKSQELARKTETNLCNKSSAKYQYSFGKSKRFTINNNIQREAITFYELPSTFVKKGGVIGRAKRDCQKDTPSLGPAPDQYNPRPMSGAGKLIFAPGRDVVTF